MPTPTDQMSLFPEESLVGVAPKTFVFEMDAEQLFESQTALIPEEFIDSTLWKLGYAGSLAERPAVVKEFVARLIDLFTTDSEFAARIGSSEDARPELRNLIKGWLKERN